MIIKTHNNERIREHSIPDIRIFMLSFSLCKELRLATVREIAVSIPAVVIEKQIVKTGKISWYSPIPSAPNVRLKKMR